MNLLDTDIIVELLRKRRYQTGAISVITLIEVLRGLKPEKVDTVKELMEESFYLLPIDNKTIKTYCPLYQHLKGEGELIPDADLLIAATAISHHLPLKSRDKHFQRLQKLGLNLIQT
ncbi:MAG: type II toxin-antitoxin system VapC family toxin [Thermoproteota archaeon]